MLALWHFSFTVSSLDESVAFYRDALGMELVHEQWQDNDYTRTLVGMPDARLRVAQLRVPGPRAGRSTHDLELVEFLSPSGSRGDTRLSNPGAAHMAFSVDAISLTFQRLSKAGVTFVSEPVPITEGVNRGGYSCYFLDPDSITLELVQAPAEATESRP